MLILSIVFGVMMLQMFLLIGGVIGYLTYAHLLAQSQSLPQHPEFYDEDGNIIADDILAIRFENGYDYDFDEEMEE
jgi:hypothetical protein